MRPTGPGLEQPAQVLANRPEHGPVRPRRPADGVVQPMALAARYPFVHPSDVVFPFVEHTLDVLLKHQTVVSAVNLEQVLIAVGAITQNC